jgi:signal transduction histidine kinase
MRKTLLFAILLFIIFSCSDKKIPQSNNQKEIISIYNKIDRLNKLDNDSLKNYSKKIIKLSQNETNEYKAIASVAKSMVDTQFGLYDLTIKNCNETILLLKNVKNDTIKAKNYLSLALCKNYTGDLMQSLNYNFKSLRLYENSKNKNGMAIANNKISDVYFIKNDFENSIKFLKKTLDILKNEPENPVRLSTYHSLANIYGMSGKFDEALKIDDSCLKIAKKLNSNKIKVLFLDNKANCFMYSNRLDSAQIYFEKCLVLDKEIGNPKQIADNYSNQAILASMQNNFPKAEKFALESVAILKGVKNKTNLLNSYQSLSDIYEKQGKLKEALAIKNDFFKTYKSLIDEKKESATVEFQQIYESEKKEKQIIQHQADVKQKNNQLIIASILALGFLIIGYLFYRQQKLKNVQQEQEFKLKSAISKIETQNKLQDQRLSISRDLHDNIGAQLTFIISSVDSVKYGFDITYEKLDNKLTNISSFAKETIVELRDTIWAMNSNEISFEDLEGRIHNFIEKAKEATGDVTFSFEIDEYLKVKKLSSVEGMNVYRTIQEAINNSLKYAKATSIKIKVVKENNQTKITILDDGIGFNEAEINYGNGLNNIKKRIEEIGGKLNIFSSEKGTSIEVLI